MRRTFGIWLTAVAIGIAAGLGVGAVYTAPDTQLPWSVVSGGGGSASSENYAAGVTLGETASGPASSASRGLTLGFWAGMGVASTPAPGDSDGDGVPDGSDNCPNWPNPSGNLPPWNVPAGDPDCDGFTTSNENQVGTVPTLQCADTGDLNDEPPPDRWPGDFNDNRIVNTADVGVFVPRLNATAPDPPYEVRYDLAFNGIINTTDVGRLVPLLNESCS